MAEFLPFMRKHGNLKKAWQIIKSNGRSSSSPYVKDDIEKFASTEEANIRSIASKIQHGTFNFSQARGVAIEKPNKPGSIRPIVIPKAPDRVVQRCILDALVSNDEVRADAFQPNSFGGIPKSKDQTLSGVPAAIHAVMASISAGGSHVIIADIASFFTKISKFDAVSRISKYTKDERFISLFERAIDVDLENHHSLWQHKNSFPYGDIGVGQGVCLSPFIGNLVLSDFDKIMNEGDCTCIRYVDDIIIVAPSGKAASSRFRFAEKLLDKKGMSFAADKTSSKPLDVRQPFEYLGIEFKGDLLRPAPK